ncbi:MAG: 50S ribosomal protein L30 [Cyanobacteria bacterium HKST-UBA05]|nr:50S ribosomal protein L30 [Cyanobacteria bacterium HKST-UBA05]
MSTETKESTPKTQSVSTKTPNLKITLVKSLIGSTQRQRRVAESLGLRRINQSSGHFDTPIIQGMIHKIQHLIKVEMV